MRVGQPVGLRMNCGKHVRMTVAEARHRRAAACVDVLLAFGIADEDPARGNRQRRHLTKLPMEDVGGGGTVLVGHRAEFTPSSQASGDCGGDCVLVGFTTHIGTVTAADDWDERAQRKRVRASMAGSYEALFHDAGIDRFMLPLGMTDRATEGLRQPRLERAIGVIYRAPKAAAWRIAGRRGTAEPRPDGRQGAQRAISGASAARGLGKSRQQALAFS